MPPAREFLDHKLHVVPPAGEVGLPVERSNQHELIKVVSVVLPLRGDHDRQVRVGLKDLDGTEREMCYAPVLVFYR